MPTFVLPASMISSSASLNLQLVAGENGLDHRQIHVELFGAILQGADVLRQAGSAKGETGLQIIRRQVELPVAAEDVHHLVTVDAQALAHVPDLVREADLQGVPGVADVFHHLRHADAGADERCIDRPIKGYGPGRIGRVVVTDDGQRRLAEVLERGAFAEELGVDGNAEPVAVLLSRRALESRNDNIVRGARQHRAADHDNVIGGLVAERRPNLFAHSRQLSEVEAPVAAAGSADTDERHAAVANRLCGVGRRSKAALGYCPGNQVDEPGLDNRASAAVDLCNLVGAHIDADHLMPVGSQRGRRN